MARTTTTTRKPAARSASARKPASGVAQDLMQDLAEAPWPVIDRYPVLLGSNVTLAYITAALRSCMTGYRQPFVDLFDELLERESHSQAMIGKRIQTIAKARLELAPAELPPGHADEKLAQEIADACSQRIRALPDLVQRLANLAWADILGVSALEVIWGDDEDGGFWPKRLHFIHSRRLAYPDPQSWNLHLWDQGQVSGWGEVGPTNGTNWGLNLAHMPDGKFLVHTPQFRNDYPTREGLGRPALWLMAFKILGMRQGQQFIERFTKIILWASYSTREDGKPRLATKEDIRKAKATVEALGMGNLLAATLADAIQIKMSGAALEGNANALTVAEWIDICDSQLTKLYVGSTFTTEPGKFGSKGTSEVGKEGELEGASYSAGMLAETLRRDLVTHMVARNYPSAPHLVPGVKLLLDKPDPVAIVRLAKEAAASGIPVDADDTAEKAGLKTVRADDPKARRMAPVKAVGLRDLIGGTPPEPPPVDPKNPAAKGGTNDDEDDEGEPSETSDDPDDQETS